MNWHKIKSLISIAILFTCSFSLSQKNQNLQITPNLSDSIKITYPDSNPLRQLLNPVPKNAIFKLEGYNIWDPSVIKVGNTYHLFVSRWPEKNGMAGWKKSEVIRATSQSLFGPYIFQEIVLSPSTHPWATQGVHNPKILKVFNKFLLYYLGIPEWKTGFAFADSIQGPWSPVLRPVISTNNPALLVKEDSSAYIVGKFKPKTTKDGEWDAYMQAFESANFNGPYKLVKDTLNRLPGNFELEDPTIWWANNQYNVICTDWEGKVTGVNKALIYYTSKNGIDYQLYSRIPIWSQKDPIPLEGGIELNVGGIERPQVYINEKEVLKAILVSVHPNNDTATYIIIRPVGDFIPNN